jgi:hypothetical protein
MNGDTGHDKAKSDRAQHEKGEKELSQRQLDEISAGLIYSRFRRPAVRLISAI